MRMFLAVSVLTVLNHFKMIEDGSTGQLFLLSTGLFLCILSDLAEIVKK